MTARYIYRAQREPVLANKSHCCNTVGIPAGRPVSTYLENSSHSKNLSVACTFYVEKILRGWSEEVAGQKKNNKVNLMTHAAFPSSSIITGFLGHKMSKSPEKRWPYYCYLEPRLGLKNVKRKSAKRFASDLFCTV